MRDERFFSAKNEKDGAQATVFGLKKLLRWSVFTLLEKPENPGLQSELFVMVAGFGGVAWTLATAELWAAGLYTATAKLRGRGTLC